MKYSKKRDIILHWKSVCGTILRPHKYYKMIEEQLAKRLPYKPSEKQIRWCYRDYVKFKIKYNGSFDVDYFGADVYRKSEFYREESLANYSRFPWRDSVQDKKYHGIFLDKCLFYKEFSEFLGRKWLYVDKNVKYEKFLDFISESGNVIFAKNPTGYGGTGVKCYKFENEKQKKKFYIQCRKNPVIIEEKLSQCKEIFSFSGKSINTIRIITIIDDNKKPHIAAAAFRIGSGISDVDNFSSGGMAAGIDIETGIVRSPAKNKNGTEFLIHPDTKKQIVGFKIPDWEEYKEFACKLAMKYPSVRYVGWDIIRNEEGAFCVIEGNKDAGVSIIETNRLFGLKPNFQAILHNEKSYDFSIYRL